MTSIGGAPTGSPRWSPDGRWIVFDSRLSGSPDIFVIGAQGGTPRQLTFEPSTEVEPSWSHDGRWIYFTSNRGGQSHIWKVPFEGGAARQVTEGNAVEPMESPDGKRLYYFRNDQHDGIWTSPINGGPEEAIPQLAGVKATRAWTVCDSGIYFYRYLPLGASVVQFYSFATRKVTTILVPEKPPVFSSPGLDVSPDGRRMLYTQTDQTIDNIMMIENFR